MFHFQMQFNIVLPHKRIEIYNILYALIIPSKSEQHAAFYVVAEVCAWTKLPKETDTKGKELHLKAGSHIHIILPNILHHIQ